MEVANKLKDLSLDINTIGLYDEEEDRKKMMNSLRAEGEALGEKKGIKQGANNEKKSIAKNLLNMGMAKKDIVKVTGLSKEQINNLTI